MMKTFNDIIQILVDLFPPQPTFDRVSLEAVKFVPVEIKRSFSVAKKESFFPFDRGLEKMLGESPAYQAKHLADKFEEKKPSRIHFVSFL